MSKCISVMLYLKVCAASAGLGSSLCVLSSLCPCVVICYCQSFQIDVF